MTYDKSIQNQFLLVTAIPPLLKLLYLHLICI
jgi:hypothetical protein